MREWKDYDDGLDYEDLRSLAHREEQNSNKDSERLKRKSNHARIFNTMKVAGASVGRFFAAAIVVFALSTLFDMATTTLPNKGGVIEFKVSIGDLKDKATTVVPGTEQFIDTSITNKSGQNMYVFLRLDCGTYDEGDEKFPIYSFTPACCFVLLRYYFFISLMIT